MSDINFLETLREDAEFAIRQVRAGVAGPLESADAHKLFAADLLAAGDVTGDEAAESIRTVVRDLNAITDARRNG
ncbi:hypothetical protein ACT1U9_01960 [Streptomyces sp. BR1]|uniref:hypothetical protein n=1 Tax=Streptomyces sp. BR1 TaxID=1592323 RepID=UPI00402B2F3A